MHFEPSELNFLLVEIEDQGYITTHYYIFGKNGLCQGNYIGTNNPSLSPSELKNTNWGWGHIDVQTIQDKNYMQFTCNRGYTIEEIKQMHSEDNIIKIIEF